MHESSGDDCLCTKRSCCPCPVCFTLAWLLAKPAVVAPIVGATKLEHLDLARAIELSLTEAEMKALEEPYRPHAVRGWL